MPVKSCTYMAEPRTRSSVSLSQDTVFLRRDQLWPIKCQLSMSPYIIGLGLLFVDSGDLWRHHGKGIGLPP